MEEIKQKEYLYLYGGRFSGRTKTIMEGLCKEIQQLQSEKDNLIAFLEDKIIEYEKEIKVYGDVQSMFRTKIYAYQEILERLKGDENDK